MKVICICDDSEEGYTNLIVGKEYEVSKRIESKGKPIWFLVNGEHGLGCYKESHFYISHRTLLERFLMKVFKIY